MTTPTTVDLSIEGMTCASCAMRIEKKLNKVPGVEATVNYATEKAHVVLPAGVSIDDAIAVVEATGYHARAPQAEPDPGRVGGRPRARRAAHQAGRLHGSGGPGRAHGDAAGPAVHLLAVGVAHAGRTRRRLGGAAVPPRGLDEPPARRRHHGHPHLRRRARGLRLVAVRPVPRRSRRAGHDDDVPAAAARLGGRARDLPRGRRGRHRVHPRRPLLRGAGQGPLGRGPAHARVDGRQGRRRRPRRRRAPHPRRAAGRGRPLRRAPRREDRDRRHRRRGRLRRRQQPRHGGDRPGRGGGRRRGHRRDRQRRRPARRGGHPGRRRHPARADRAHGGAGAAGQGARPAARRPGLRGVRPDRHRAGARDPRRLAARSTATCRWRSPPPCPS